MIMFNEKLETKKTLHLLSRSIPYYLKSWQEIDDTTGLFGDIEPTSFNMKDVGTSSPVIEYVVLPHVNILCILAAYLYKDDTDSIDSLINKDEIINYLNKGLLWMCETHITGSLDINNFLERKRWGENWRSGKWAALMGICAFLCKKFLPEELFEKVKRIVAFEADRFIDVLPPSGFEYDTKLEENAQDTLVIAWALALQPQHAHAAQWEHSLNIWAINIASAPSQRADHSEHLDKSVSHWTITQTLYPDMTAENHGFFNPEILTYGIWVVLSMAAFRFNNRAIPSFLQRRVHQETFDILLRFCLPNGMTYAPCCHDLPFFIPHPFALAWGIWNNDPRTRRMTAHTLNWMESKIKPSQNAGVPWIPGFVNSYDGWELFFQSTVGFELAMLAVIPFPKEHRFYSIGQIEGAIDTSHIYPYIQVCYRRNTHSTRSMAWKALSRHPMIGLNIHSYPELLFPYKANLLGIPTIDEKVKSWDVAFHNDYIRKSGFDTFGRIQYFDTLNQKVMHRDIRVLTWGDDGIVIFDRIVADKELYIQEQYLSPVYIVNDQWTNNKINLVSGSLKEVVRKENVIKRHISCPSFWASIEGTMLFQFLWGCNKGLTYIPGNKPNAPRYWKNCRLDMLGVYIEGKKCMQGDIAYDIGFFLGVGKGPRPFKSAGTCQDFFKGIVIMDGKNTVGLD